MLPDRPKLFEEDKDYIDESHISAFAKALVWDSHNYILDTAPPTPGSPGSGVFSVYSAKSEFDDDVEEFSLDKKPDLITSKNDWFPVNEESQDVHTDKSGKTKDKTLKKESSTISMLRNEFRNSSGYMLLRWPLLILVFSWITILGLAYFSVRVYVALSEYMFTWTGERRRLRDKLRKSTTYDEWVTNALNLDKFLNLDQWSKNPKFSYYDYKTVKLTINKLRSFRKHDKDYDLMILLQACLKRNFAGIENRQLYSHRYYGTKNLVHEYYEEVVKSIDKIIDSHNIDLYKKRKFFKIVEKNYGKTALCLSGGACFAYTHFGLAKALIDVDLLPKIISGTSGGGLIAAILCTRTNEELKQLLVPELARKITACEDPWYVWFPRFWRTGARFDAISWARKSNFFTRGSTTFEEAYARTGRKLNISTVPSDPHSPVILCNDITSPHCIIWSTLLASSAVPGILNPVVLMMKNPSTGEVEPFSLGSKWRDGSLRTDIPIDALNNYYNVNFTVVSQVNPHISLFFFAPKGTVGRPVSSPTHKTKREKYASLRGGFIATALEQLIRLEIKKWLQIIKTLDLLPNIMSQDWSNIWLQNFTGSITIWPRNRLKDFWYILSDPTEQRFKEILLKGERSMFPRILFVKHRMSIERAIEKGKKIISAQMKLVRAQMMSDLNGTTTDDQEETSSGSDYDYDSFRQALGSDTLDDDGEIEDDDDREDCTDEDWISLDSDDCSVDED
ncbi:uncharacterized protein SPAPADRAFT_151078 [Spathaspora passalidarum NRRL Y-27907]|uniref:Patatin-like phospholipase domain-containing protein n=1 Tax=Spathaspora passalidarum (strain NRRL Y-27907 / 11-Y1) TaxID=619300 RepID=G3ALL0_SPAPN|nr:uncharacterized protein SPAPADRAFT_151078 [Spathaspora passalidarum NRRL Y-27907]EGW33253.1 hypothetical protein SPAPADRAFT_151078 [Spathaspora passalidarum NRRL Y-27907]